MMAVGSHQWNNIYVAAVLPLIIVLGIFLITLAFFMKRWKKKISGIILQDYIMHAVVNQGMLYLLLYNEK